ncbi:tubulin epsilon and delta complex protein 2 isoform X2 [Heptranchias perlo]|uniref:tubulin epsilon and delta complex protein 2 isoform X2 n=1 Tax=Heptranchias perlo TaxID=212740 RepID=UPI00355A7E41
MLPASRALRLSSLLVEAIEECMEEERKLEEKLKCYRKLLKPWNPSAAESPVKNGTSISNSEHDCTSDELQELEVLNRALAKALRIRQTQRNVIEMELTQPHTTEGSSTADTGSGIAKEPPAARSGDKPSSGIEFKKPQPDARDKAADVNTSSDGGKVVASKCKERCLPSNLTNRLTGKRGTVQIISSRKPVSCTLKGPYETKLEVRRKLETSAVGRLARGSLNAGLSAVQTGATRRTKRPVSVDRTGSRTRQNRLLSLKTAQKAIRPHSVETPADTDTAPTPAFAVVTQQRVNSIKESAVHSSASGGDVPQDDSSSKEKPKLFTLQGRGLWEKVSTSQTDTIPEKARFMQRIQSAFHSQLPTVSYVEIEERLGNIRDFHKCIDQCVHTEPLLNSSGPLSWQHEYESLQTLERCQDIVSSLLHQIEQLKDAEAFWVKFWTCWRPSFKMCKGFGSKCAPLLFYSSLQELKEMEALRFHVQTLQRQIQIQKAMAEELLPVLFSSEPPEQSLYHLYRAVYSQVCEGGEKFPALVVDNIPE